MPHDDVPPRLPDPEPPGADLLIADPNPEAALPKSPVARRTLRILAIVAGLLILLVAALPYVVSFDAVRGRVLAAAEAALHRKVEAGTIRLQIFSGLGAHAEKVIVRNKPGWESPALLTAEHVSVRLAFWPLLARRAEVRKVVLDGVTVTVERDPKGALNVDDFLEASGRPSAGAQPATAAAILISNVDITRGRLQLVDRRIVPGETVTTAFDEIAARIAGISASAPAHFDLAARFLADSGRNVALKGSFGPPKPGRPLGESPLGASLSAKNVALAKLGPYLGAKPEPDPGVLALDATVNGAFLTALKLAGSVVLAPREGGGSTIPALDGQFVAVLDWPHGALTLESSPISVARLPLVVHGRVDDLRATPRLDLALSTPGGVAVDLDGATWLPGMRLPPGLKLSGRVSLTAELTGPASDLSTHASISAAPLGVDLAGKSCLSAANATATLESRGEGQGEGRPTGRITVPVGKLGERQFDGLLADWSWDEGTGTLLLAPDGSTAAPAVRVDVSGALAKDGPEAGKALCDALEEGLRQLLGPAPPAPPAPPAMPAMPALTPIPR